MFFKPVARGACEGALGAALDVLMPLVRAEYAGCDGCIACTAFLRRYLAGERRLNPTHFDMEAP